VHKSPNTEKLTITITPDVRRQLEKWASANITSLSAELMRSARERAAREAQQEAARS
jgi:hypothetical protein